MDAKEFIDKILADEKAISMNNEEKNRNLVENLMASAKFDSVWEDAPNAVELVFTDEEIQKCASDIDAYLLKNIKTVEGSDADLGFLNVFIPESVNSLISKRFDNNFTTESRDNMLDNLNLVFSELYNNEDKKKALQEALIISGWTGLKTDTSDKEYPISLVVNDNQLSVESLELGDAVWMEGSERGLDTIINISVDTRGLG